MGWSAIINFTIISLALLLGGFLRSKIYLFQRFLIPSSIIGGFFLLIFYNYFSGYLNISNDLLGDIVYHLLNISFIAMVLRVQSTKKKVKNRTILTQNTIALLGQYALQLLGGLLLTALLIKTLFPALSPAFGLTLTLGFELGPGQAYSIASVWENMGFPGASSIGLIVAAIGFLVGSIGGVILINQAVRRGWIEEKYAEKIKQRTVRTGFISVDEKNSKVSGYLTTESESLDSFTFHIALVAFCYLLSFGMLSFIEWLLHFVGPMGTQLAESLWGVNFIFSMFCAAIVKKIIVSSKIGHLIDNETCNRISGVAVDYTVAASLGAICLATISSYWIPIILIVLLGIIITCFILPWYCSRLYSNFQFYRMLMIFGTATGTLPTALALIRVVDPDFETPVAQDYVYASGIMFFFAIPVILCANLPALSVVENNPFLFWIPVFVSVAYFILFSIGFLHYGKGKILSDKKHFFYVGK